MTLYKKMKIREGLILAASLPVGSMAGIWIMLKESIRTVYSKIIHKNVVFGSRSYADSSCRLEGPNFVSNSTCLYSVNVGRFTYFADSTIARHATIGRFCSIGPSTKIGLGMHPTNRVSTSPVFYSARTSHWCDPVSIDRSVVEIDSIEIGNDVWIGAGAVVFDGVRIGDGAVIAAGAVVVKDVEPYSIVGGVPAKIIKWRVKEEYQKELLSICWWNWDLEKIRRFSKWNAEPEEFVRICRGEGEL